MSHGGFEEEARRRFRAEHGRREFRWRSRAHASAALGAVLVCSIAIEGVAWWKLPLGLALAVVLVTFIAQVSSVRAITRTYARHGWY